MGGRRAQRFPDERQAQVGPGVADLLYTPPGIVQRPVVGGAAPSYRLTNFSVIRSLSPMSICASRSSSGTFLIDGGRLQTPSGWSAVSAGLALISDASTSRNPLASALATIQLCLT